MIIVLTGAAVLAIALLLAGCASTPDVSERVKVVRDLADVKDCTRVTDMAVTSGGGGFAHDAGFHRNRLALQRRTVARGGDTLLILDEKQSYGRGSRNLGGGRTAPYLVYKTHGDAYRCGTGPVITTPSRYPLSPMRGPSTPPSGYSGSNFGGSR